MQYNDMLAPTAVSMVLTETAVDFDNIAGLV